MRIPIRIQLFTLMWIRVRKPIYIRNPLGRQHYIEARFFSFSKCHTCCLIPDTVLTLTRDSVARSDGPVYAGHHYPPSSRESPRLDPPQPGQGSLEVLPGSELLSRDSVFWINIFLRDSKEDRGSLVSLLSSYLRWDNWQNSSVSGPHWSLTWILTAMRIQIRIRLFPIIFFVFLPRRYRTVPNTFLNIS